jgi:16S rRNA (guanine966-N2)-methyltransferase
VTAKPSAVGRWPGRWTCDEVAVTRVVAGRLGGRRLAVPTGRATRPTSERVREALFSTVEALRGPLQGARFLDLFAGSGAVGIEAASRGATQVTCVDNDARALTVLRANVVSLGVAVEVSAVPVERLLANPPDDPWDVVFLDPPYADPVDDVLASLAEHSWLGPDAVVVVERAARGAEPRWPAGIQADRSRRYGDTMLWYGLWYGRRP